MRRLALIAFAGLSVFTGTISAENYYVNNLNGRDRNDGLVETPVHTISGPVQTIRRALELVGSGDTINLANTGTPYYESISFVGLRHSGVKSIPLTLAGNGATLSGLRGLPRQGWNQAGKGLWQLSFSRKGDCVLLRNGFLVTEHRPDESASILETLPVGQWAAHRGSVYFRQDGIVDPTMERFDYGAADMGITFYQVEHVRIQDLIVQHFRIDGINAYNMTHGIILDNVTTRENGRAGLAVGGTSSVRMLGGNSESNGRHSVLITGKGSLETSDPEFDVEPDVKR